MAAVFSVCPVSWDETLARRKSPGVGSGAVGYKNVKFPREKAGPPVGLVAGPGAPGMPVIPPWVSITPVVKSILAGNGDPNRTAAARANGRLRMNSARSTSVAM